MFLLPTSQISHHHKVTNITVTDFSRYLSAPFLDIFNISKKSPTKICDKEKSCDWTDFFAIVYLSVFSEQERLKWGKYFFQFAYFSSGHLSYASFWAFYDDIYFIELLVAFVAVVLFVQIYESSWMTRMNFDIFPELHGAFSSTGQQRDFLQVNAMIRSTLLLRQIDPNPNEHFLFGLLTLKYFQNDA